MDSAVVNVIQEGFSKARDGLKYLTQQDICSLSRRTFQATRRARLRFLRKELPRVLQEQQKALTKWVSPSKGQVLGSDVWNVTKDLRSPREDFDYFCRCSEIPFQGALIGQLPVVTVFQIHTFSQRFLLIIQLYDNLTLLGTEWLILVEGWGTLTNLSSCQSLKIDNSLEIQFEK